MLLLFFYLRYNMEKWCLCIRWVGEMIIVFIIGVYFYLGFRDKGVWFKDLFNNSSLGGLFKGCSFSFD